MNRLAFYAAIRARLSLLATPSAPNPVQVSGFDAVLLACAGSPLAFTAYMLATAWHETNKTMQPVREAYWLSEEWRKENLRYYPWYGRGYVQLTWQMNYEKADLASSAAGLISSGALLANLDFALRPDIAALVMRRGMDEGWFTGVKLSTVLPNTGVATRQQYMNARTIINGHDKADLIEDYAQVFERALRDGGWS